MPENRISYDRPHIHWAFSSQLTALEDMGMDHGGSDFHVAEQFPHGADIIAVL
jgi:hypothetical protein